MGYYAYVPCNCYKNGQAKPFPVPEVAQYFELDTHGWQLNLPDGFENKTELEDQVIEWLWTACEHREMLAYHDKVTRSFEMGQLNWLMRKLGIEKFLVFWRERENMAKYRTTSPDAAAWMLEELSYLEKQKEVAQIMALVDSATGRVAQAYIPEREESPVLGSGDVQFRFDAAGVVMIHPRSQRELWRAKVFEIHLLTPLPPGDIRLPRRYQVEYVALDSDRRHLCHSMIAMSFIENEDRSYSQIWPGTGPKIQYHIEQRTVDADYFQDTIDSFKEVCQVSVAMNNPIHWTD